MKRSGDPAELMSTALYFALNESSFTNGEVIAFDGGFLASGVNQ